MTISKEELEEKLIGLGYHRSVITTGPRFYLVDANSRIITPKTERNCLGWNIARALGTILLDLASRWSDGAGGIQSPGKWNVIAWATAAYRYIPMIVGINSECDD